MTSEVSSMIESPLAELTHLALSLDALNCAALLVSRSGTIAHVNSRFCDAVVRSRQALVGSDLAELYPIGESRDAVRKLLGTFDDFREAEFYLPLPDEKRLPVLISSRAVGTSSVLAEYAVVTLIDISRQKKAEQQLVGQNESLAELSDLVIKQSRALRDYADSLEQRVEQRTRELHDAHIETIYILAMASDAKDADTGAHVRRLKRISQQVAERIGISPTEAERIGYSAVLHDVGKIHTSDLILKKPGPLTVEERTEMQQHTLAGERILKPSSYFEQASRIARSHHENWDGSGYPDRLRGADIPLEARVVHLVDVFDALTHPRVYKPKWDRADALDEIIRNRGKMFDPAVVDTFVEMERAGQIEREP